MLVHRNKETEIGGAKKKERSNEDGFLNESATPTVPVASTREAVRDKSQLSRKEKRDKKEGHQLGVKSGIDDSTGALNYVHDVVHKNVIIQKTTDKREEK